MDKFLAVGLTILFIGLKLTDKIDWSWLWVMSPLWIYLAVALSLVALLTVVAVTTNSTVTFNVGNKD